MVIGLSPSTEKTIRGDPIFLLDPFFLLPYTLPVKIQPAFKEEENP
jgi:hypothetical protein